MLIEIIPNWHPIFVHFTVALLSVAAAFTIAAYLLPEGLLRHQITTVARWNLWLGAIAAIVTVIAGFFAFNEVAHTSEAQHQAMLDHRNWALATAGLFLVLAAWSLLTHLREGSRKRPALLFVLAIALAAILLAVTGFKGGELVYRHGLGVLTAVAVDAGADVHQHDEGEAPHADDGHAHGH